MSNSRSKVLYLVSAGDNFLEKYESGVHCPLINCCRTAPTAISEASVLMLVGAFATGWFNRVAFDRAVFAAWKASDALVVQVNVLVDLVDSTADSGDKMRAHCGMNL